jgi:molecular chaperone HscB
MTPIASHFQQNFFALFNLPVSFQLDLAQLEQTYRTLQTQVHPDKFAHLPETERRLSMQWSTHVNEAYQTLRKPLARARYLLTLQGVETQEETNTAMPVAFLMQQMEWREEIAEARDALTLEKLQAKLKHEVQTLQADLLQLIDYKQDYSSAAGMVRKLRFLEKLAQEIDAAFDELER